MGSRGSHCRPLEQGSTACLLSERIGHDHLIWVPCFLADVVRYIRRSSGARFIFEASQVSFDFIKVYLELYLMRESYIRLSVLIETSISRAINHHPNGGIGLKS